MAGKAALGRSLALWVAVAFVGVISACTASAQAAPGIAQRQGSGPYSLSPASTPPVTVADLIGMTTIGSRMQGDGKADYDVVSPDGSRIAVVVKRGNLERNTVDFALLVFETANLFRAPHPDTVATFSSSSTRPGISQVTWLGDNRTVAFLGERPGELPQVYTLDTRSRTLTRRTSASTAITIFTIGEAGEPTIYAAPTPLDTSTYAMKRAHGFVVPRGAYLHDLIAGVWADVPLGVATQPRVLHVVQGAAERTVALPDSTAGFRYCDVDLPWGGIARSPMGDVAIVKCYRRLAPAIWARYRHPMTVGDGEYVVIDLVTGRARPLVDAPAPAYSTLAWAPDSRSVVVGNMMLPPTGPDSVERATHGVLAEVDVHTGAVTVIAPTDTLSVVSWDGRTGLLQLAPGLAVNWSEARRVIYKKASAGWVPAPASSTRTPLTPPLIVDQGMNTPPRLVAVDPTTHGRHVVFDLNPKLLETHRFGREDVIHWKTKAGTPWFGGLYWPPDYVPGKRYPLVIQTHGFDSTTFWPYGIFSTGEAAQPLANHGIVVLQVASGAHDQYGTPREAPAVMEGFEGAIDYLDSLGLIDRGKVGLQGFSHTCYHVLYFLTHSRYPIATATLDDGVDFSYLQYLAYAPVDVLTEGIAIKINGGEPLGAALTTWRERAPGFNLDHVTAPLLLTARQTGGLLGEWEPYAGLLLQGKPAELVYLPDDEHIVRKPWIRLTSQQGAVDWWRFWLQGEEDADPTKAERYARWHELRGQRDATAARDAAGAKAGK